MVLGTLLITAGVYIPDGERAEWEVVIPKYTNLGASFKFKSSLLHIFPMDKYPNTCTCEIPILKSPRIASFKDFRRHRPRPPLLIPC